MARVLFPLDGTPDSFDAIPAGLDLLGPGHEVTLLAVMQEGFEHAPEDRVEMFEEDDTDQILPTEAACQEVLAEGARRCAARGIEATPLVRKGRAVAEILAACEDHDVLVMHALAKTRLQDRLHFSSGGQLTRRAGCHVLLVHLD